MCPWPITSSVWFLPWTVALAQTNVPTQTIRAELSLRTGGAIDGAVLDHNHHGLVIVRDEKPYVFAWTELDGGNACLTRRQLLVLERGGEGRFTAGDFYLLGRFALTMNRDDLALRDLRRAQSLDPALQPEIAKAFRAFRERRDHKTATQRGTLEEPLAENHRPKTATSPGESDENLPGDSGKRDSGHAENKLDSGLETPGQPSDQTAISIGPLTGRTDEVLAVYERFGEKVREVLGDSVVKIESPHFLIYTDFETRFRPELANSCETMYAALCRRFGLAVEEPVFPAKCPVFAFQSKRRFEKFARYFDGYDGVSAIGYTRSIEANGHVHLVLHRQGRTDFDRDRFDCTLAHEGTHAFLHRLYTSRLIPHWINEGLADLTAAQVLGDRCPAAGNAALLARQFVRYDWPIMPLLESTAPIEVHQYPLAHSVIAYLESRGAEHLAAFIKNIKNGATVEKSLANQFDGLSLTQLDLDWRKWVRDTDADSTTHDESSPLPWKTDR